MRNNLYSTKSALEIKDLDSENRKVVVYLAKFGNIDSDNDMFVKGAFSKSLQERGPQSTSNRKIAFLRHHNWEMPIGKFLDLSEDDNGLYAVGQLGRSTLGEDAFKDYEDGIIREHSIGFQYIGDKTRWMEDSTMEKGGYYQLGEVKLFEGSAVTFGANEMTNVVEVVKSEGKAAAIDKITNELDICIKALSKGKGTDERLYELEMKIKYLNSQLVLLANQDPILIQSVKSEPVIIEPFNWSNVVNNLKF
jgi:HK97 family phage prohead protease